MNPLSAIRLAASPEFRPEMLAKAVEDLKPQVAPGAELEKISPQIGIAPTQTSGAAGGSFSSFLGQMVQDVNAKQMAAGDAVNGLLTGQNVSLHQAMVAMEEASVSFQLMVEVRNRLLESYQELMRMQI